MVVANATVSGIQDVQKQEQETCFKHDLVNTNKTEFVSTIWSILMDLAAWDWRVFLRAKMISGVILYIDMKGRNTKNDSISFPHQSFLNFPSICISHSCDVLTTHNYKIPIRTKSNCVHEIIENLYFVARTPLH